MQIFCMWWWEILWEICPLFLCQGQPESITEALNFAKDVVIGKFQSAKKDNEFVYHDSVPSFESLPEIKGKEM